MRKLGLISGMGPESSILYYQGINRGVFEATAGARYPEFSLENVDVNRVIELCAQKDYDALADYLLAAVERLAASGAEFAAMSTNTPHIVFDQVAERSPIPLVSIVEATCQEAQRRGLRKIGLIGTIFTMTGDFFPQPFLEAGIQVITPNADEKDQVNSRIVNELELGIIRPETLEYFQGVVRRMRDEDGIEAVVLGCTEIPLIMNDQVSPVPCLDTTQIHIAALVDAIMKR